MDIDLASDQMATMSLSSDPPTAPTPSTLTKAEAMATESTTSRLMMLPRELRDNIYGHLHREKRIGSKRIAVAIPNQPLCIGLYVQSGPVPFLLRVSRQFSNEYSESISQHAELEVIDCGIDRELILEPIDLATTSLRLIKRATIKHMVQFRNCQYHRHPACDDVSGLESYMSRLLEFAPRLTFIKRIELDFVMVVEMQRPITLEEASARHDFDQVITALDEVTKNSDLPLTAIRVAFSTYHHDHYSSVLYSSENTLCSNFTLNRLHSQWTAAKGWQPGGGELVYPEVTGHRPKAWDQGSTHKSRSRRNRKRKPNIYSLDGV